MADWRLNLKASSTQWLLERDNPSVRYLALKDLLDKADSALEVVVTRQHLSFNTLSIRAFYETQIDVKRFADAYNSPK